MTTSQFLAHLHRVGAFSYYHTLPERRSTWFKAGEAPALPTRGTNWYFGVHPCCAIPPCNAHGEIKAPPYVRAQKPYIAALNCLYAEFDAKTYGSKEAIREHLEGLPLAAPSVLVDSGGGLHAYWLLQDAFVLDTPDRLEAGRIIQELWVYTVGGDPAVHDLTRVLRVPGTKNFKYDPPRPVEFLECDLARLYPLVALTAHLPRVHEAPPRWPIEHQRADSIQEYNERNDIGAVLSSYGYRWKGTRRMISPHSGGGGRAARDGVSIDQETNRAFVHTGGDPLCDGYWKRPFDVLCILDYAGDFKRALEAIRR
jgi:hypothetical protein